jgi:hypothetical protein
MAGFEVTLYGRIWVTPEVPATGAVLLNYKTGGNAAVLFRR